MSLLAAIQLLNERSAEEYDRRAATVLCGLVADQFKVSFDDAWFALCSTPGGDTPFLASPIGWGELTSQMASILGRPFSGLRLTIH